MTRCGGQLQLCMRTARTTTPIFSTTRLPPGRTYPLSEHIPQVNHAVFGEADGGFHSQITAAQASAGSTSVKSFALEKTCNGASMAGGVFWR
jgi:hypothetical protein